MMRGEDQPSPPGASIALWVEVLQRGLAERSLYSNGQLF
jgi:hypothetical protein